MIPNPQRKEDRSHSSGAARPKPPQPTDTKRRFWSKEDLTRISELYPEHPTAEVARLLGRGIDAVYRAAFKLRITKTPEFLKANCRLQEGTAVGRAYRFPKGYTPANKGIRRPGWNRGRMRETQFKKGERSGMAAKKWVPIGTIRLASDGYLRIKVREAVFGEPTGWGNPDAWPQYHRHVWKQHNGPIPPKHIVIFKDGDRTNCAIGNLELISMAENARRNRMWGRYPRELAEAIQLNGTLKRKLNRSHGQE